MYFYTHVAVAQVTVKQSAEINLDGKNAEFQILNLGANGLAVFVSDKSDVSGAYTYNFYKLNSELDVEFSEEIPR